MTIVRVGIDLAKNAFDSRSGRMAALWGEPLYAAGMSAPGRGDQCAVEADSDPFRGEPSRRWSRWA